MIIRFKKNDPITYTDLSGNIHTATVVALGQRRIRIEIDMLVNGHVIKKRKFVKPEKCEKL